jgi:hypothetical protein
MVECGLARRGGERGPPGPMGVSAAPSDRAGVLSRREGLSRWAATVSRQLPQPSRAQAAGLALRSYGIVLARCRGLSAVAARVAASSPSPSTHRPTRPTPDQNPPLERAGG